MLKIRMSRIGKKGQPMYRIVVSEARSKRDGSYTDIIGWYNSVKDGAFELNRERYDYWKKNGAQPTEAVERLVMTKEEKEKRWPAKPKQEKKAEEK